MVFSAVLSAVEREFRTPSSDGMVSLDAKSGMLHGEVGVVTARPIEPGLRTGRSGGEGDEHKRDQTAVDELHQRRLPVSRPAACLA